MNCNLCRDKGCKDQPCPQCGLVVIELTAEESSQISSHAGLVYELYQAYGELVGELNIGHIKVGENSMEFICPNSAAAQLRLNEMVERVLKATVQLRKITEAHQRQEKPHQPEMKH